MQPDSVRPTPYSANRTVAPATYTTDEQSAQIHKSSPVALALVLALAHASPRESSPLLNCAPARAGERMDSRLSNLLALHGAGHLADAERGYRECLRDGDAQAGAPLAALLLQQQRYDEAASLLETIAAAEPERADVAVNFSVALRRRGRVDEALEQARRATSLAPGSV